MVFWMRRGLGDDWLLTNLYGGERKPSGNHELNINASRIIRHRRASAMRTPAAIAKRDRGNIFFTGQPPF